MPALGFVSTAPINVVDLVLNEVLCRTVRSSAAVALGKLSALSTRIDSLVGDLLSGLQVQSKILFFHVY